MFETAQSFARRPWPDYRAVWRWHFYAGLFCIPFVIVLSISGSIYLFKPQIESWIDRHHDGLAIKQPGARASDLVRVALAAVPGSTLNGYEMTEDPRAAARVIVNQGGQSIRVYVHPEDLRVLKTVDEDARFMRVVFRLHGELLMGNGGSAVVELAASWAIVMIATGLYLWWPRNAKALGGVVYPRLGSGSRKFWRDIHGVTGFWVSGLVLFLLLSGLPWAKFWGDYFRKVRWLTGTAVARQDWTNGRASTAEVRSIGRGGEHGGHGSRSARGRVMTERDLAAIDRIVATVRPLGLAPPVIIAPPARGSTDWTAKSMTPNRPRRVDLVVDGTTGAIKDRKDFKDRHFIDRVVGTCIAAHEGQRFGWPNQLLGLVAALGLIVLSTSSLVLWWRRREPGVLGAPAPLASARLSAGLLMGVVLFALYLPLFGASLIVVKLVEKTVLCRIPRVRDWLGLAEPASSVMPTVGAT